MDLVSRNVYTLPVFDLAWFWRRLTSIDPPYMGIYTIGEKITVTLRFKITIFIYGKIQAARSLFSALKDLGILRFELKKKSAKCHN